MLFRREILLAGADSGARGEEDEGEGDAAENLGYGEDNHLDYGEYGYEAEGLAYGTYNEYDHEVDYLGYNEDNHEAEEGNDNHEGEGEGYDVDDRTNGGEDHDDAMEGAVPTRSREVKPLMTCQTP